MLDNPQCTSIRYGERCKVGLGLSASKGCKQMPSGTTSEGENDEVTILQHRDSPVCDVIVVFRGREMVLRLPNYKQALKWARMECKAYQLPGQFYAQAANQSAER